MTDDPNGYGTDNVPGGWGGPKDQPYPTPPAEQRWENEEHVWIAGLLMGELMRCHVDAHPVMFDDTTDYSPDFEIRIAGPIHRKITIRVLPP
jgi:hypothetical protein